MMTASHSVSIAGGHSHSIRREEQEQTAIWEEAYAWLALIPTLFITVGGSIHTESGPVAFRFTAMQEDSLGRRLLRLSCSLLMLFLVSARFREILAMCKQAKLILLFPALAFASTVWSQNPSHTLVDAANLTLTTLFAVYLCLRYPGERLVSYLTFAASIALLLSIGVAMAFPSVGIDAFQQDAWRGIFDQRNNCAAVCVLFLVVGLHYRPRALTERLMRESVVFLSAVFIVMSGSRTGWILTLLALILVCGLRLIVRLRSLDRLFFLMVVTVPTLLLVSFIATNFNEVLALMDKDPTMTQRTIIWAEVLPSIAKHPFCGYGYSSFWTGLSGESLQTVLTTGWMEGQAQDGYLDVLLQLGLLGLVPLAWAMVRCFKQAVGAIERRTADSLVQMAIILLPVIMVENIGESSFLLPLGIPWFYALISLSTLSASQRCMETA
jgi:exopolysaccharide production protein ExoQ